MKKLMSILLAALLILGAAACAKKEAETPAPAASDAPTTAPAVSDAPTTAPAASDAEPVQFKTLGEVLSYESLASSCYEDLYVHIFEKDGVFYRVEADITEDIFQKLFDLDFFDPDKAQKTRDLLGEVPVKQTFVLSEALLSQAELDALAGKTGQELLDMGFVPQGSYGFGEESSWASLDKGPFSYEFNFVEQVLVEEDDPDVAEVIRPLTVKDAAFSSVSDYCTEYDFDLKGGRTLAEYEAQFDEEDQAAFYAIPEIPLADSPFQILADVFAVLNDTDEADETPAYNSAITDTMYIIAFDKEGAYYRVEAEIPEDVTAQLNVIDFFDEKRDEKYEALLGPLPVTRVADLSAVIPAQEELDALVGMTGQELLDMGFAYGSGYSFFDKAEMYLVKDLCEYHFYFNETVPEREDYDEALDEIMQGLTVAKVEFFQLSEICSDPDLAY